MSAKQYLLKCAKELLVGGKADGKSDVAFSKKELERGTEVEKEHTNSRKKAKEIAKDHLIEHPKYYQALEQVEEYLEREKKAALSEEFKPRKHQEAALKKILKNRRILMAHATGTGKTLLSIAGVEKLREQGHADKTLVVVPAALKKNFSDTLEKFTDSTFSDGVDGKSDYQLVSYDAVRRDPEGILDRSGANTLVADEIHRAKDSKSKTFKSMLELSKKVDNFIGLTGSLVSNDPSEVTPLLNLVDPKQQVAKNESDFKKKYLKRTAETYRTGLFSTAKRNRVDLKNKQNLRSGIQSLVDYVSHDQMKDNLPSMNVVEVKVPMSKEQDALYNFAMGSLSPWQRQLIRQGLPVNQSEAQEIFAQIMKSRQASNAIHTHKNVSLEESAEETPKIKRLIDDVEKHLKDTKDGQAVLYTHFVQGGADALMAGLKKRGIPCGLFAGTGALGTTEESRHKAVSDFKEGKIKAIVLTPAANEGISLNNATAFFELDRHYNPEKNQQAIARARRLGGLSHRKPEDRTIEVRKYYSVPQPSFLDKMLGRTPKGVDEWIQTIADEKNRLNEMFREVIK